MTEGMASKHVSKDASKAEKIHIAKKMLTRYVEKHYGIEVRSISRLDRGVYRVDRQTGNSWVVRVFPPSRPFAKVLGDAEILRFLEKQGFPAERCATQDPVTAPLGRGVLVTDFVEGTVPERNESIWYKFGEMLGRLNMLPIESGLVMRDAGSIHHFSGLEGKVKSDIGAAISLLDSVRGLVPPESRLPFDSLYEQITTADTCEDLPLALIHPDPLLRNGIVKSDSNIVWIDWTGAGHGPRLLALALLIWASPSVVKGVWSHQGVDAVIKGYSSHVRLQEKELTRLAAVIKIRPLVFACWRYHFSITHGRVPNGSELWWLDNAVAEEIAAYSTSLFEHLRGNTRT
jgi:Ser/Thr protein kinase RdoA (MazF antagonist)